MTRALRAEVLAHNRTLLPRTWPAVMAGLALLLSACAGMENPFSSNRPPPGPEAAAQPQANAIGTGQVKVALILPLTAQGNAGQVGLSMRNAAELAIAEFNNPDLQLLVKDDAGSPQGAQTAAQQAIGEGAEIILGPLFAQSVQAAGQAPATSR